jgi:hypothetical protein
MTIAPVLVRAGLVTVDPETGAVGRVIAFQYNPDSLSRTIAARAVGSDGGERSEALRLAGPATETIKFDAEFDGTQQLAGEDHAVDANAAVAAIEALINPSVARLRATAALAAAGTLEITPTESALLLFVWGKDRVMPVRIAEFAVSEDAFTPALTPIRIKVSLTLRVLSVADLPAGHRGSDLFLAYRADRERVAGRFRQASLGGLGGVAL